MLHLQMAANIVLGAMLVYTDPGNRAPHQYCAHQGESHLGLFAPCPSLNRLVGLVVKASDSGSEDPGFESRLRRDSSGS